MYGLVVEDNVVTGVHSQTPSGNITACVRHGVILATGVMGNARILSSLTDAYAFFGQPVMVILDYQILSGVESCDPGTISGGTFHKIGESGFLSTLVICKVKGLNRIVFASPQAVSSRITGTVTTGETATASINYDDDITLSQLKRDVKEAAQHLYNINITLGDNLRFENAGYHWSGNENDVHHSRFRDYKNLFIGDAMAIVGKTHGWTSFNARVAGALAAKRAMQYRNEPCAMLKNDYEYDGCCVSGSNSDACHNTQNVFQSINCCDRTS